MVFEDRVAKYPGRWTMVKSDGTSEIVTLIRNDEPTKEGTPINAATLNELSTVAGAINAKEEAVSAASTAQTAATSAAGNAQSASADADRSESAAASAEDSANRASAIVSTDKTLSVEGAPADAKATGDALSDRYTKEETDTLLKNVNPFPVGSIYQSTDPTSPAALFGGTWQEIAQNRVLMGASSTHTAGTTVEAGLPNIKGSITPQEVNLYNQFLSEIQVTLSGAFKTSGLYSCYQIPDYKNNSNSIPKDLLFDASNCNPIYGGSTTVQPAAYYVHIWKRVA